MIREKEGGGEGGGGKMERVGEIRMNEFRADSEY